MNTGFLGPAVATVLTACGIETPCCAKALTIIPLQQYLPLAVLKQLLFRLCKAVPKRLQQYLPLAVLKPFAATHKASFDLMLQQYLPLAVLKQAASFISFVVLFGVATVLTACGIETAPYWEHLTMLPPPLQQYLPFTVFNRIYDKTPRRLI